MKKIILNVIALVLAGHGFSQTDTLENLGSQVNSVYHEIRPTISADGQMLYYVVEGNPKNTFYSSDKKSQDIWFSQLGEDGKWGPATQAPALMNAQANNAVFWISPDGNRVMIRGAYENGVYKGRGFSMLNKEGDGWSKPQMLNVPGYESLSKDMYSGGFMTSNGKHLLIYLSEEKNSFVNDIYVSHLQDDNTWTKPESLGTDVNTFEYDEISPFMAADGVTLYFASNRPGGLGEHDIWMVRRLDESWKKWSKPVNLGAPVNTPKWDAYFTLDASGQYAYLSSMERTTGGADLVKTKLDSLAQPNAVVLVYGKVIDAQTKLPMGATLYYDELGGKNEGNIMSEPQSGDYKMVLPYGKKYVMRATADSFNTVTDTIDLTIVDAYKQIHRDLYLTPEGVRIVNPDDSSRRNLDDLEDGEELREGEIITLNNVYFVFAKAYLKSESYPELDKVVKVLKANPGIKIELSAHTDWIGSREDNMKLSQDRATATKEYLEFKGVELGRIISRGYGETKPIANNMTAEGRQMNRRVEFTVIK
ncbi:MAG: OmpA family protein [Chitinophagaceae bacterium]|nr:MAG: OmpA family protein [Chitinophagaceae bacterium]